MYVRLCVVVARVEHWRRAKIVNVINYIAKTLTRKKSSSHVFHGTAEERVASRRQGAVRILLFRDPSEQEIF